MARNYYHGYDNFFEQFFKLFGEKFSLDFPFWKWEILKTNLLVNAELRELGLVRYLGIFCTALNEKRINDPKIIIEGNVDLIG